MNIHLGKIQLTALTFVAGVLCVAGSYPSLSIGGKLSFEPNPGALAGSPFGRTVGTALQGPITRFWDRGVGSIETKQEAVEGSRPDQKLFNWVVDMRESKTDSSEQGKLYQEHKTHIMARIEKKLALAWQMDPRNFANYTIYQMFLWEDFSGKELEATLTPRELSQETLEVSLADVDSPVSLLTAGQASYDLVFTARTSKEQSAEEASADIRKYSQLLPELITKFDSLVDQMRADGRWDRFSEVKKSEFEARKQYLSHLSEETRAYLDKYGNSSWIAEGGAES